MLDRAPQNNPLRRLMDACLPGLENRPNFEREVLNQVRGEVKVKKKLSIGLVLMILCLLAAATALAAALLWEQQVVPLKEIEQQEGDYAHWPISQKEALIHALIDSDSLAESDETARLFDPATGEAAKHALADALVLALTGQRDINEISVDILTYAVLGPSDTWTPEQRVWWQQVTQQFYGDQGAPDTLVTPNGKEPAQAEAIALAKAAILTAYGLPPEALEDALPVANLYVTDEHPDYRRWEIQFKCFKEGTDQYLERVYIAVVDEAGQVIADPDLDIPALEEMAASFKANQALNASPIIQAYQAFAEQGGHAAFQHWPLALKAAYSQKMRPMVQSALANGTMNAYDADGTGPTEKAIIASTCYAYGLPASGDIDEAEALSRAAEELAERYGRDAKDFLFVFTFFDVTDPNASLWRFVFLPAHDLNATIPYQYRIELNPRTGEIVSAEEIQPQQILESLAYDVKLY